MTQTGHRNFMRIAVLSLILATSILAIDFSLGQEKPDELPWETNSFDVAFGEVQILHSGKLSGVQIIHCRFSIDDYRNTQDKFASVALMFTSADAAEFDVKAYTARLAAYRHEDDDGWRHEFTLTGPDDRNSRIVAYTGTTDKIPPMFLVKAEYPKVTYAIGNADIDVSQVDISGYPVASWQIVAIGVKGESRCSIEG